MEKTIVPKDTRIPVFTAALFTVARTWKQPKCSPTEERIKKQIQKIYMDIYIYIYIYSYIYYIYILYILYIYI